VTAATAARTADRLGFGGSSARTPGLRRSRRRWRLTVDSEQPSRRARVSRLSSGCACRSRTTSSWSICRWPPVTPARVSKSSGATVIRRVRRIRARSAGVVPPTYPATSCWTTAAYRQRSISGQSRQACSARATSALYCRRSVTVASLAGGSSKRGFWNTEASSTQRGLVAELVGRGIDGLLRGTGSGRSDRSTYRTGRRITWFRVAPRNFEPVARVRSGQPPLVPTPGGRPGW
jgi:hypothetical protein